MGLLEVRSAWTLVDAPTRFDVEVLVLRSDGVLEDRGEGGKDGILSCRFFGPFSQFFARSSARPV
jgi:hypothetical protein